MEPAGKAVFSLDVPVPRPINDPGKYLPLIKQGRKSRRLVYSSCTKLKHDAM
jgi:hypothetical protein